MSGSLPPVIAIDGPSASGKGTVARLVACALGFHYLDSGALYRLVGLAVMDAGISLENESKISWMALNLNVKFNEDTIVLNGRVVTDAIRDETISNAASRVAALPGVRRALLERQRALRQPPGLVADGRDMGSVVFPDATLKIFLTASAEARAGRRYKQLMEKGMSANMDALLQDISGRDARDSARAAAPLQKCADAIQIDTTGLTVEAVVEQVLTRYKQVLRAP
ncbi:MAG: (d)CMP kinase [Pseudomonadota bacterium]